MAKTHRRRAARLARQTAAACARAAAVASRQATTALFTNHDWKQVTTALDGLLRLDRPSPFTDLNTLAPQQVWITVDLHYVRFNACASTSLRQGIVRAVDALVAICTHAELLRAWEDLFTAFWTRVFTSDMYQNALSGKEAWVGDAIRSMRTKGTYVALRWHGRRLSPAHVIKPLERLFQAAIDGGKVGSLPVRVGLALDDCQLTMADLKSIHELLKVSTSLDTTRSWLCEPTTLHMLSLKGTPLYANHFETLVTMFEDPVMRRIDGLCLSYEIPTDASMPDTYAATFQRILATVFTTTKRANDATDPGVRLSLEACSNVDARFIEAVENALVQADRPVRALSLASVAIPDFGAVLRLMRLINTPFPTATSEFELDLSCLCSDRSQDEAEEAFFVSLAERVTAAIPRIFSEGIVGGQRVTCRLLHPEAFEDQLFVIPVVGPVSTTETYEVTNVTHNGFFQILLPPLDDHERPVLAWVNSTSIASIRIGEAFVVGSNCTSLVMDGLMTHNAQEGRFMTGVVAATGANLRRLSLQRNPYIYTALPTFLSRCPQLVDLNAQHCSPQYSYNYRPEWLEGPTDLGTMLQVLNITDCGLLTSSVMTLPELPRLRCLHVAENPSLARWEALESLLERLRSSGSLEYMHIGSDVYFKNLSNDVPSEVDDMQRYLGMKDKTNKLLRDEYVTLEGRLAFLSAVPHVEAAHRLSQCLPHDAIAAIFELAGTRATRSVVW